MKKIVTLSMIAAIVIIMSDCSPKVAKNTASTENKTAATENKAASSDEKQSATRNTSMSGGNVVQMAQGSRTNDEQVKALSETTATRVETGGQLYATSCSKCHDLFKPATRSASSWVEIMKTMGPKAELEVGPYLMISSYLIKNAKG